MYICIYIYTYIYTYWLHLRTLNLIYSEIKPTRNQG